ncbi:hypothetical protein [Paraburkholderia acidiphila]|uniref:Uncharacterized protein n=1 Tax=Paraburkholderia acidiphila TaxID=2571747 RepID=A0A7Z2G998_9BURK|nr:hypothetical protein [Paraburkholderia acidiphila]QGZ57139.1 hypothetical protein FAZ97_19590 [Paraburkholderia acidiphila]
MNIAQLPCRLAKLAAALTIVLVLVCAVLAGLARLGVRLPLHAMSSVAWHGVLMLPVFFGALVSLERAVALQRTIYLLAPACAIAAGIVLIAGAAPVVAQSLLMVGASVSLIASLQVLRRQAALHLAVLALAVFCWWLGNLVWLITDDVSACVLCWLSFLILTIAGERLELTRMLRLPRSARYSFFAPVTLMIASLPWALWQPDEGTRLFAAGLVLLAVWLARHDIARRTVRQRALTRFIAVCLLGGYGWLALGGVLGALGALMPGHPWYDAALHALTLGFVFSMVFGHAPVVVPALTRLPVKYHPMFYLPLFVLHTGLAMRVAGGLAEIFWLQRAGGIAGAVALAFFALTLITAVLAARGGHAQRTGRSRISNPPQSSR